MMKELYLHQLIGTNHIKKATLSELKNYKLICKNIGIEWEALDYHLNIESMLQISEKKAA